MTRPLLVLAWGNLSRGDDALGPLCLAALRDHLPALALAQVDWLEEHQLQVEHTLDLLGRQAVLLVDASVTAAAPFDVSAPEPRRDASFTSHALTPQALLQVFADVHGVPPPPATLLAIRGEAFELGEPVGPLALTHLAQAVAWAQGWVQAELAGLGVSPAGPGQTRGR